MRLARLEIQTLPGIEPGFTLENIAPGINMVTGPNAVGKSSLIRALGYLVGEPRSNDPLALSLTAVFEGDEGRWTVRRTGREIVWERNGRPVTRPSLPERDQFYCYWLCMEDLLQADQRDDRLVAELRRSLSGGYDLKALRQDGPFELRSRIGQNEARRLREAEKALREVEAAYETLRREEARIPSLEAGIEAARRAGANARLLEQALVLLDAQLERQGIEAGLAEFPSNMAQLRGDERERLQVLDSKREELRPDIEGRLQVRDAAQRRLLETGLIEGRPERAELETRSRDLEQARRKSDQREQQQKQLEQAGTAEKQALTALGGNRDVPRLDPDSVSEAETLASQLQTAERRRQELADRLEDLGDAPDQASLDGLLQAAEALRTWLTSEGGISGRLRAAIIVAGVGSLLAAGAGFLVGAWLALVGGVLGLVGALWALLGARGDGGAAARRSFDRTGLEPPRAWQRQPVEARFQEIEARRAELQQQVIRAQQAEEVRRKLTRAEQGLEALQQQKTALGDKLGFDPALTAAALDRFVRLVQDYERAHREREATRVAIDRLDAEIGALTEQVRHFLDRWQSVPGADDGLNALEAGLVDLGRRGEQADDAEREMREAEREQKRLKKHLAAADEDEAALFREAGLEPGQRTELAKCGEQLEAWRRQQERLRDAQVLEAERRKALEGKEAILLRVEADEREGLEQELERAREEAKTLEALQEELTTIRTRLSEAGHDHRLEHALSEVDGVRSALEDRYHEALFADAVHLLLDGVEREYRSEHEPEVLRDARERFRRFTHHTFELEMDDTEGFMARDVQQQARRSLSELSSGIRMQLLLAMRLAWARLQEQGREALPLFLDEALTTSDEHRFGRVADSLEQLARDEGRQVFYLSARRHEVALWERATGTRPHHIDLARERFGRADAEPEDFVLLETEPLPAPEDHSPESYAAALGVSPVDPRQPEGIIHLFHLLRDNLPLLHDLMENWRITTLGHLEGLLRSSAAADVINDTDLRRRLESRCAAVRAWVAVWRHGRGKPVDPIALDRSGAVSDKFMDHVTELAESLNGDGAALIEALRVGKVAWFHSDKRDDLEQWLEAEGYIDPEEPLAPEDRQRQTLMDTADRAAPEEIREIVRWLEAGLNSRAPF